MIEIENHHFAISSVITGIGKECQCMSTPLCKDLFGWRYSHGLKVTLHMTLIIGGKFCSHVFNQVIKLHDTSSRTSWH